jgi:ribosomal protein S1
MPGDRNPGESFAQLFESENVVPRRRTLVPGAELDVAVVQIGQNAVFVALDDKQEGYIEAKELTGSAGQIVVKPGSMIRARVVEVGGRPGAVRLSPITVREGASGEDRLPADHAMSTASAHVGGVTLMVGAHVKDKVALVERYGVFVQLDAAAAPAQGQGSGPAGRRGVRGLIPSSELGLPRGADAHRHFPVGKEIEAKIVAIDERGRIRLSVAELAADEERRAFEVFESKTKKADPAEGGPARLATLGDLLNKFGSGSEKDKRTRPAGSAKSEPAHRRKR